MLGGVTLELITPDQQVYRFDGKTLTEALEAAFPVSAPAEPEASAMTPDIFD